MTGYFHALLRALRAASFCDMIDTAVMPNNTLLMKK